jgi:hypothetical protein
MWMRCAILYTHDNEGGTKRERCMCGKICKRTKSIIIDTEREARARARAIETRMMDKVERSMYGWGIISYGKSMSCRPLFF